MNDTNSVNDTNLTAADPYLISVSNSVLGGFQGRVCLGLRPLQPQEYDLYSEDNPPPEPGTCQTTRHLNQVLAGQPDTCTPYLQTT